jgi:flagellar motor switch protein FliM
VPDLSPIFIYSFCDGIIMTRKEILSRDEIDALLSKANEASSGFDQAKLPDEITVIDFANQERITHSQFPVLEQIYERFTRKITDSLCRLCSSEFEVIMDTLKISKYREFMHALPKATVINIIRVPPLRGKAMIIFDAKLVFTLVEYYFGGDGRYKFLPEQRELTVSELRVAAIFLKSIFEDLKEAWSPIMDLNFEVLKTEMNPQLVTISSPNDVLLVSHFEIKGEENGGKFSILFPYAILEPVRDQLELDATRSDDEVDPNWMSTLQKDLLDVPLKISSTLTETKLNLRDVLHLKEGDVIPITMPDTVTLNIEDVPSFRAQFGISNDKCALKIIDAIKD